MQKHKRDEDSGCTYPLNRIASTRALAKDLRSSRRPIISQHRNMRSQDLLSRSRPGRRADRTPAARLSPCTAAL